MNKFISLVVLLIATVPHPAAAQLQEIRIEVDGLACPFCAYTLEKDLKKIDGVNELAINIQEGTATLTPGSGMIIDLGSVSAAVENAGFTPRAIMVSAAGHIEANAGTALLVDPDGTQLFRLEQNEVLSSFEAASGRVYEVRGVVVPSGGEDESAGPPLLALVQTPVEREGK